jgi:hypothetical protein
VCGHANYELLLQCHRNCEDSQYGGMRTSSHFAFTGNKMMEIRKGLERKIDVAALEATF